MQVDKGRVLQETLARLSRLAEDEGVLLQPWKKDRSVYIILQRGVYQVIQRGFSRRTFVVEKGKIRKVLKSLCRKEFPRSNKIWLTICLSEEINIPATHTDDKR